MELTEVHGRRRISSKSVTMADSNLGQRTEWKIVACQRAKASRKYDGISSARESTRPGWQMSHKLKDRIISTDRYSCRLVKESTIDLYHVLNQQVQVQVLQSQVQVPRTTSLVHSKQLAVWLRPYSGKKKLVTRWFWSTALRQIRLVPGWVTVCGWISNLGL